MSAGGRKARPHTRLPRTNPGPLGPVPSDGGALAVTVVVLMVVALVGLLLGLLIGGLS